jgi:hypothetical protein
MNMDVLSIGARYKKRIQILTSQSTTFTYAIGMHTSIARQ